MLRVNLSGCGLIKNSSGIYSPQMQSTIYRVNKNNNEKERRCGTMARGVGQKDMQINEKDIEKTLEIVKKIFVN